MNTVAKIIHLEDKVHAIENSLEKLFFQGDDVSNEQLVALCKRGDLYNNKLASEYKRFKNKVIPAYIEDTVNCTRELGVQPILKDTFFTHTFSDERRVHFNNEVIVRVLVKETGSLKHREYKNSRHADHRKMTCEIGTEYKFPDIKKLL